MQTVKASEVPKLTVIEVRCVCILDRFVIGVVGDIAPSDPDQISAGLLCEGEDRPSQFILPISRLEHTKPAMLCKPEHFVRHRDSESRPRQSLRQFDKRPFR